jgi:hypothetical protein
VSRGPGRMMRAAVAELDKYGYTTAWSVARRAAHDAACGCDYEGCGDRMPWPTRAELVSARRAIHTLAASGEYVLARGHHGSGHGEEGRPPSLTVAKPDVFRSWQHIRAERRSAAFRLIADMRGGAS